MIVGLIIGLFIGAGVGCIVMGLIVANKRVEE